EVDGWAAHGSRPAFQRDRIRQNALINAGYRILRFTWDDIANREQFCVDQIISALDLAPSTT
ncbi:MAG: endonuclease domain-containing protein, partial [Bifidobacteriaceae bacterium]|nr:endonuclease domain-containing protein [Bifidobacteriaceae bacterium]